MDLVTLGKLLHKRRETLGIPATRLAKDLNIGRTTIWLVERGENPKTGQPSRPARNTLERWVDALSFNTTDKTKLLSLAGYEHNGVFEPILNGQLTRTKGLIHRRQWASPEERAEGYIRLAEEAESELRGSQQVLWLTQLELELESIKEVLNWLQERKDTSRQLRISSSLSLFWEIRGYWKDGRDWIERGLAQSDNQLDPIIRAKALLVSGILAACQGDYRASEERLQESKKVQDELGYMELGFGGVSLSTTPKHLALTKLNLGKVGEARELAEKTQIIAHENAFTENYEKLVASSQDILGLIALDTAHDKADYEEALSHFRWSLTSWKRLGFAWHQAITLNNLGLTLTALAQYEGEKTEQDKRYEEAENCFISSLELKETLQDKRGQAFTHEGLAFLRLLQREYSSAWWHTERSSRLWEILDVSWGKASVYSLQGLIELFRGHYSDAKGRFIESLQIMITPRNIRRVCTDFEGLATIAAIYDKDYPRAALLWGAAKKLRYRHDHRIPRGLYERLWAAYSKTKAVANATDWKQAWERGQHMSYFIQDCIDVVLDRANSREFDMC